MREIWVFEVIRESSRHEFYYFPGDLSRERIEAIRGWNELLSLAGHRSSYPPAGEIVATRTEAELRAADKAKPNCFGRYNGNLPDCQRQDLEVCHRCKSLTGRGGNGNAVVALGRGA